ncbi:MAG: glycosyltransferase, partial [Sphaerochaetaceae bacterium]|nr:glycosyltransferase [Sphaerochaetaceae bacterium]
MKILIISPKNKTLYNFRGDLIKKIIKIGHKVYATGPNYSNIEEVNSLGVIFLKIPSKKSSFNIISDITYTIRLINKIKKIKPDLIFSYTIKPMIFGNIAARISKVGVAYTMVTGMGRVFDNSSWKYKIIKRLLTPFIKFALKKNERVIFQ